MAKECCTPLTDKPPSISYKKVLRVALFINLLMFCVEVVMGLVTRSVSLQADAIDFLGDACNYGISLFVIGMALKVRSRAALLKGLSMAAFGIWVIIATLIHIAQGTLPEAPTMGLIGLIALCANGIVLGLLWSFRSGDSNMRSVWLCSRNDVIGNLAVMIAAAGVFGTGTGWPDFAVAFLMAILSLQSAFLIIKQSRKELNEPSKI